MGWDKRQKKLYHEDMLEEALKRILQQDARARLVREGKSGILLEARGARALAEDLSLRAHREELLALTQPLWGAEQVWAAVIQEAEQKSIGVNGAEVHIDPVFGIPLALPFEGPNPVAQAGVFLVECPFYTLAVVEPDGRESLVWRSPYWLGELAPAEVVQRVMPKLAKEVLAARSKGATVTVLGKARHLRAGELAALHFYGEKV